MAAGTHTTKRRQTAVGKGALYMPDRAPRNKRAAKRNATIARLTSPTIEAKRTSKQPQRDTTPTSKSRTTHCSSYFTQTQRSTPAGCERTELRFGDTPLSVDEHDRGDCSYRNADCHYPGAGATALDSPGPAARGSVGPTGPHEPTVRSDGQSEFFSSSNFLRGGPLWMNDDGLASLVEALQRPCECEIDTQCSRWSSGRRRCHPSGHGKHVMAECRRESLDRWWVTAIVGMWAVRCVS